MATMETWRNGPMGFSWEHMTPEECDKKHDFVLREHATKWHDLIKRKESNDVSG